MLGQLLHTPEGVRDIYNSECERKYKIQERLHGVLGRWGYKDIQTPGFEFFDIFRKERGTVAGKDMYRFFDRDGNTLVLRPDFTPSIARCAAKYYRDEPLPLRLCYAGNTYVNNIDYQGKTKEMTQIGAELIQDGSVQADAEMVVLMIESLLESGLKDFQVEIGNADFFRGLVEEAGFGEDETTTLKELIEEKYSFGVEAFLSERELAPELKKSFMELPQAFGSLEQIRQSVRLADNKGSLSAIARLEELNRFIELYGYGSFVTYDLGMLGKLNYYSGIIFRAYTYGTGEAIASGGRYDNLVGQFGKEAAAIGMAVLLDRLMLALERQKIEVPLKQEGYLLVYGQEAETEAVLLAGKYRRDGIPAVLLQKGELSEEEYRAYGKRHHFGTVVLVGEKTKNAGCTGKDGCL